MMVVNFMMEEKGKELCFETEVSGVAGGESSCRLDVFMLYTTT